MKEYLAGMSSDQWEFLFPQDRMAGGRQLPSCAFLASLELELEALQKAQTTMLAWGVIFDFHFALFCLL